MFQETGNIDRQHQSNDVHERHFAELFCEYEQKLYVFVKKITYSDDIAKDIVQDVFLKLWLIRDKMSEIENINAYIYKLTENKVYDYLRKAATEKKAQEQLWERYQAYTQDHSETLIAREYDETIEKAIEQLPPQRKKIYLLSKHEGMKQTQIAEHLHISHHTVRNHLSEAFKQIGVYLKQNLTSLFF